MNNERTEHVSIDQLQRYVQDRLSEREREQVDLELLGCEQCLQMLMAVMEDTSEATHMNSESTSMPNWDELEERVIGELLLSSSVTNSEMASLMQPLSSSGANSEMSSLSSKNTAAYEQQPTVRTQSALNNEHLSHKKQNKHISHKKRSSWLQHPITHYTIAASITLLLLASGALSELSRNFHVLEDGGAAQPPIIAGEKWSEGTSWSERVISRTGGWLDELQNSRFK